MSGRKQTRTQEELSVVSRRSALRGGLDVVA